MHEMKLVQMLQLGRQMEQQLMCISRHLLNLPSVISDLASGCQNHAEVSFHERHSSVLIHPGRAQIILQPRQEIIPGINHNVTGQVLQGLLHAANGDVERRLVSVLPRLMRSILMGNTLATTTMVTIEELLMERSRARGPASHPTSAKTTSRWAEGRKTVGTTTSIGRVHPSIFKITRGTRWTIVGKPRMVSVTGQGWELFIRANLPSR